MNIFLTAALCLTAQLHTGTKPNPTNIQPDSTYIIRDAVITESIKEKGNINENPLSSTTIALYKIENEQITSPKELSLITPNFYIPDYGSKMTSSIYVRGLGARIDNPAIGLYIDNIPYLNKNNFDIEFYDIRKVEILRGPQGTLYGRNAIGGVMNIYTLSPFSFQGIKAKVDYGSWNTLSIRASYYARTNGKKEYQKGYSISGYYKRSDGAFTNNYDNTNCGSYNSGGARARGIWHVNKEWELEHTVSADIMKQKGYAYAQYDTITGKTAPISYNDPCSYRRFTLTNGIKAQYTTPLVKHTSMTTWQYTDDKMILDQDFTDKSMFTMSQSQKEHTLTQDFIVSSNKENSKIDWLIGLFTFHKNNRMTAPVSFGKYGIDELILKNANEGIHNAMPFADLIFRDTTLPLDTRFSLPTTGVAAYGQITYKLGEGKNYWLFTGGLRFDYEHASMTYHSLSTLAYKLTPIMQNFKKVEVTMRGTQRLNFNELLPKFSILKAFPEGNVFISAAKGYKAGGFNTQIFSDILQTKLMNTLMPGGESDSDKNLTAHTTYKPEYNWNYELGTHLSFLNNRLIGSASLFYILCHNQQITVFPKGESTGRMMSNAGKSRSYGAEVSIAYIPVTNLKIDLSYGYTNAKFIRFNDGNNDYKDKYVPYAPQNTYYAGADYSLPLHSSIQKITFHADLSGAGKIYWDEANKYSQNIYNTLSAYVAMNIKNYTISVYGKNLTDSKYNTFYFKSVGNSFVQKCRERSVGISVSVTL